MTLRLDADLVARFRASGPGWQTRINAVLREALVQGIGGNCPPPHPRGIAPR
ncbi:BrnA antitoxin family protein [uncultured Sphaerotilus sp.]|uniref:BrnA antitoxin family protein n=1 Tax=uncultured Sphaerotilus sp. TaxID=474984 RepID=UPI0030CA491E